MRNTLNLLIALALASSANATDRVVSPSGTYNTISSAIAASSDGDRVLVQPGIYPGFFSLSKSLTILPAVEGSRYTVNGSISLTNFNGKSVAISGARIIGGITYSGPCDQLTQVRLADCYTYTCDLDEPALRLELYRDTISGEVRLSSGTIAGCTFRTAPFMGTMIQVRGLSLLTEEVWIVGNVIGHITENTPGIAVSTPVPFHIENNFIAENAGSSSAISIELTAGNQNATSTIINNSFFKATPAALFAIANVGGWSFNLIAKNNAYFGYTSGLVQTAFWSQLIASNNLQGDYYSMNSSTGQPVPLSSFINAGDPDPRYLDLDLTVNDVGCYGGSNSRANFTTPMGGAVVGFMQAPRVVAQGESVNINAVGFDR